MLTMLAAILLAAGPVAPRQVPQEGGHRGFVDAARLADICLGAPDEATDTGALCLGYTLGVVDQMFSASADGPPGVCLPTDVKAEDLAQAVRALAPEAFDAEDYAAADLVGAALVRAFPCPHRESKGQRAEQGAAAVRRDRLQGR